jgi:ferredoxin
MVPQDTKAVVMCNNKDKGADARKACKNACIGCKKCERTCPNGAIKVIDNLAVIDYEKCTGCGACVAGCPTGCLKSVIFPDLPEKED